eukprot:180105-Pleurochrysis_carterae.AAC.1
METTLASNAACCSATLGDTISVVAQDADGGERQATSARSRSAMRRSRSCDLASSRSRRSADVAAAWSSFAAAKIASFFKSSD